MTDAPILVDRSDPAVAVVTIDRADQKNAMTLAMWTKLGDVFEELGAAPEIRAVILTGAGGAFCAGADIKEFGKVRDGAEQAAHYAEMVDRYGRLWTGESTFISTASGQVDPSKQKPLRAESFCSCPLT